MNAFENFGDVVTYGVFLLLPVLTGGLLLWLVRLAKRAARPSSALLVIGGNVAVFLLLVSIALASGETYYRFFCDTTDSWGLTRTTQRWFHRHWTLNRAGFRDSVSAYPPHATPGRHRLTFLGDSFTAGHGLPDVEDRFANRIRNHGSDEVHVLANIGFDTGDELKVVEQSLAQGYEFDRVVLVYNLNDISDISPDWKVIAQRIYAAQPPLLLRRSFLCDVLYYRLKGRLDPDIANYGQSLRKDYDGPVWDEQQRRLKDLYTKILSHHGQLLVVTFPFLQHLGPGYEFRAVHAKLDKFWQDLGVPHLDLLPLYEAHRDGTLVVNSHDAHPNAYAHALAAEAIADFLRVNAKTAGR